MEDTAISPTPYHNTTGGLPEGNSVLHGIKKCI